MRIGGDMFKHQHFPGRIRLIESMILGFLVFAVSFAAAEQITVEYNFETPEMSEVTIGSNVYDRITVPNAPNSGDVGWPALPARGTRILLPPGAEVSSIEIVSGESVFLGQDYLIEPVPPPFVISATPDLHGIPTPDSLAYMLETRVPGTVFEETGVQSFRGYKVLILKLQPVQYIPKSGELYYVPNMTVVIETAKSGEFNPNFRGFPEDETSVRSMVDNPEVASSYEISDGRGGKSYDLLIITVDPLVGYFQDLKDYHDTTGIPTEIHTTDDIGSSSPDDVRDYIRERYLNDGIEYVLIGGDDNFIPAKDLYVEFGDEGDLYTEYHMPVDMYFACLDGTYNYDGDDKWGEPNDGESGGEVDLIAEVYVGRASVGGIAETFRFVDKTIRYLTSQEPYLDNVLLLGEHLGFSGLGEYGAFSMDQLVDRSSDDGYSTVAFPSTLFEVDKLYDLTWSGNDWPNTEVCDRINSGVHIVNHYGHCWYDWAMKMTSNDIVGCTENDDLCFMYSQGCMAGGFDMTDCWAEFATIKSDNAAFAVIMNARYGLGAYGTDGPSHRFNREFWDAVFNPDENKNSLGKANQDSKEENIYRIDESGMRWCHYEITLFGDPTVSFRTQPGITFDYPDDVPQTVTPLETGSFEVVVSGICEGTPVPGSGQLHYIINRGELHTVSMTQIFPDTYEATLPAIPCGAALDFYVSAEEATNGRFYDPDPGTPWQVVAHTDTMTVFEDDFETDMGWTAVGDWARGVPTGNGGSDQQYGGEDPTSGCVGENVYGYNLNGDYANGLSETHLTSPSIDCSGQENIHLKFCRWLGVDQPENDNAWLRVSSNGLDWVDVWHNSSVVMDNLWAEIDVDISDVAALQPTLYLRWTMGSTNGSTAYCGWNIDHVRVVSYGCSIDVCGDADNSDAVDIDDVVYLISYIFSSGPAPEPLESGDADCSGDVDIDDVVYLIGYIFSGGNAPCDVDGDGEPDC